MSIREACEHGRILLGLEASHKLSQSLSDVLRARLIAFHQTRHESASHVESAENEAELQWLTAQAGVCLLGELSNAVSHALAKPVPSTSTSAGVAPLFGAKDLQVLRQLGAVVARWGLAANCKADILPTALKDPRNKQSSALYDEATEERLQSVASRLARLFADSPSTEFTNALLPHLQLAFAAALFQLAESPFISPVRPWATDALLRLLDRQVIPKLPNGQALIVLQLVRVDLFTSFTRFLDTSLCCETQGFGFAQQTAWSIWCRASALGQLGTGIERFSRAAPA